MENKEVSIKQIHYSTKQILKLLNDVNVPLSTGMDFMVNWEFIIKALTEWKEFKRAKIQTEASEAKLNEIEESDLKDDDNPFLNKNK